MGIRRITKKDLLFKIESLERSLQGSNDYIRQQTEIGIPTGLDHCPAHILYIKDLLNMILEKLKLEPVFWEPKNFSVTLEKVEESLSEREKECSE